MLQLRPVFSRAAVLHIILMFIHPDTVFAFLKIFLTEVKHWECMLSLGSLLVPRHFSAELPARWRSIFMKQHKTRESFPSVTEDSDVRKYLAALTIYVSCYEAGFYLQCVLMQHVWSFFSCFSRTLVIPALQTLFRLEKWRQNYLSCHS